MRRLIDWRRVSYVLGAALTPAAIVWPLSGWLPEPPILRLLLGGGLYGALVLGIYAVLGLGTPKTLLNLLRKR